MPQETPHEARVQELEQQLAQAQRENKKLQREMAVLQRLADRIALATNAQSNLSGIIRTERSRQERFMSLLMENAPDIMFLLDENGRVAYCTEAFLQMAGIRSFGLINGRTIEDVFSRYENAFAQRVNAALAQAYATKEVVSVDAEMDFAGEGAARHYSINVATMLDENGRSEGALILFHDLTELLGAKQQAEQANRAKSDFLATISHEIRTPMNAIMGIADLMKKTPLNQKQKEYMQSIQSSSGVLLGLINDILDFSKIEAGKLELLQEYFSLTGLLNRLSSMFGMMFGQKPIQFVCEFAPDLPRVVFGDEKRVGQILTNLLNNALKYTNEGTVWFRVSRAEGNGILFAVSDTGIGIREEALPRLFAAFEQLDRVKNKQVVGTGLGLAISRRLALLMDGTIDVQSVYGEGSTFAVRLTLPEGNDADLPARVPVDIAFEAPAARVLVVDDIDINLMVASAMLESFGIRADEATGGQQAIEFVKNNHYDLIFMDHMMPDMDGVEATLAIRTLGGEAATTPIVALTANAVQGAEEMFLANGFSGFLSKPIDSAALGECLLHWLPPGLVEYPGTSMR